MVDEHDESGKLETGGGAEADGMPSAGGEGQPGVGGAAAAPDKLLHAREVVAGLLGRLGVEAAIEVRDSAEAIACSVEVKKGGEVFDVGPKGQVLEATQYLVNKMVNRDAEGRKWVTLELGGFREPEADPEVEGMAARLAELVRRSGRAVTVVPLHARDRRRVHVALANAEDVRTRSVGQGLFRRLIVEKNEP
jgi:spoIIIJ-associated protein